MRYRIAVDFAKAEKPSTEASTLRLRTCRAPGCRAMFFVCVRCDRGQRYCCDVCRKAARRGQTCGANARYQRTKAGTLAHRARQKIYRARLARRSVTYQGATSATAPRLGRPIYPPTCAVCGHQTVWVNPFTQMHFRVRRFLKCLASTILSGRAWMPVKRPIKAQNNNRNPQRKRPKRRKIPPQM